MGTDLNVAVLSVEPNRKRILFSEKLYERMLRAKERAEEKREIERVAKRMRKEKAVLTLGDILKSEMEHLKKIKGEE